MHRRPIVEEAQGVSTVDFDRFGQFPQQGIANTTRDLLYSGLCYAGLLTTQSSSVNVQVALGRVYDGGSQFASEAVQERSVADYVPTVAGRSVICLLVAQGQEQADDLENRYYERPIDPANPNAGTQQTVDDAYRTKNRKVILTVIPGTESVRPVAPASPTGAVAVAEILVTTSGIQSVTMRDDTRAKRLDVIAANQTTLSNTLALLQQTIDGFRADLAATRADLLASASASTLAAMQVDMALLKDRLDLPDDGSPYWADRFLDYGETDWDPLTETGHPDFSARVQEGIRFPYDNVAEFPLSVLNPNDPNLKHAASGLICPRYTAVPGIVNDAAASEMPLGGVSVQTITVEHLTQSRERVRYGSEFMVCNNSAWWQSGRFDPIAGIFTASTGETYEAAAELSNPTDDGAGVNHQAIRVRQFWKDEIEVPYDKYTENQTTISGVVKAQTFLQHQERWVPGVDLAIKRWGAGAQIKAVLVECDSAGRPDPTRALQTVELNEGSFRTWPQWTPFDFSAPVFTSPLAANNGRARPYGVMFFTTGDVDVATSDGQSFMGGNLFTTTDGVYFDGDLSRDLCFRVRYARFDITDIPVRLGGWNLSGGIETLDVLAPMIVPGASRALFQINVGGSWRSLDKSEAGSSFLNGTQALYDAQVLLSGTEWAMPVINTVNSRVRLARPKSRFTWIGGDSKANGGSWEIGVSATQLKLKAVVAGWDAARHTLTPSILYGNGYGTVKAATGAPTVRVVPGREVARPDQEYAVEMEWTFDFTTAVNTVKLKIVGETNNYKLPFHPEWAALRVTK